MSIAGRFNKLFGIQPNLEEEKARFVNRINQVVFRVIDTESADAYAYSELFERLCIVLGENASDLLRAHGRESRRLEDNLLSVEGGKYLAPEIRILTRDNFTETMRILCILYAIFKSNKVKEGVLLINKGVYEALSHATCDLGVQWKDGLFYPSGAEELDKALLEEPLVWLAKYPNERKDYKRALECYLEGTHLGNVIKNCYLSLEGVTRAILGNDKTLDNNKDALLAHINLSDGWKSILGTYIHYANDFRHASEDRYTASKEEAEAFLYMTGLIMRLLVAKK
jgi:hypothetical protein